MKQNPSYYAIIPANVRYDKALKPMEKIMFAEITALTESSGYCHAGNSYFAELYEVSNTTVSKWISSLKKQGYIDTEVKYKDGTKEIEKRFITLLTKRTIPPRPKRQYPIDQKDKENTTRSNVVIYIDDQPENLNLKAWAEFEEHRKGFKEKLTDLARKKLMNKIKHLSAENQQECIDTSIENSWKGLFPEKFGGSSNGTRANKTTSGQTESAATRAHRRNKEAYEAALIEEQGDQDIRQISSEIHPQVDFGG